MSKLKTHKATAKRVKVSAGGKLLRQNSFGNHMLSKKSKRRKRAINRTSEISGKNIKNVKRALGGAK